MQTGSRAFNSSKLFFPSSDSLSGIDLEFLSFQGKIYAYLQVHFQAIPPYQGNPKEALVTLQIEEKTFTGIGYRHEGGQRLLLSLPLQEQLLSALKNRQSVTIRLEGYKVTVVGNQFPEHFKGL